MEDSEKNVPEQVTHKPACWCRYVDDTSVIWPYGQEKPTSFWTTWWISCEYLVHSGKRRKPPYSSRHWHLQETGLPPKSQSLSEAHPYQSSYTLGFTSPTCEETKQSWLPWYTESQLFVGRTPLLKNWNFSQLFKRKMDTALSRYKPWTLQHRLPRST